MKSGTFPVTLEINGAEFEATAEFDYTPPDPGHISGPPENCYPPEHEVLEITSLHVGENDLSWALDNPDLLSYITDEWLFWAKAERGRELCDD